MIKNWFQNDQNRRESPKIALKWSKIDFKSPKFEIITKNAPKIAWKWSKICFKSPEFEIITKITKTWPWNDQKFEKITKIGENNQKSSKNFNGSKNLSFLYKTQSICFYSDPSFNVSWKPTTSAANVTFSDLLNERRWKGNEGRNTAFKLANSWHRSICLTPI